MENTTFISLEDFKTLFSKGYNVGWFYFFRIFEIIFVCFVVAICDLVHSVEAIHCLC